MAIEKPMKFLNFFEISLSTSRPNVRHTFRDSISVGCCTVVVSVALKRDVVEIFYLKLKVVHGMLCENYLGFFDCATDCSRCTHDTGMHFYVTADKFDKQ